MPRLTRPSPTNVGMSAAGRKIRAMGRFLTRAMSSRDSRLNWISAPSRRLSDACWSRPSGIHMSNEPRAFGWWGLLTLGYCKE
jgi:hypothetical protein